MTDRKLEQNLKTILSQRYPNILVSVQPDAEKPGRKIIRFVDEGFRSLYPHQRYHYLVHLVPESFYSEHLAEAEWIELAPGEIVDDLEYPDDDLIKSISPDVMRLLKSRRFLDMLDEKMFKKAELAQSSHCDGSFSVSKGILEECGFNKDDYSNIFHVLMAKGAFCDCEILYNVAERSNLKDRYWSEGR